MKSIALPLFLALLLTACDGGFAYQGQITSSAGVELTECTDQLENLNGKVLRRALPIDPLNINAPNLRGHMIVAPRDKDYFLVITCKDHAPFRARVRYGSEVLPDKDMELGDVVIKYTGRT